MRSTVSGSTRSAGLHRYAASVQEPRSDDPGLCRRAASGRAAGDVGGGGGADLFPAVERRLLHHRQLSSGRRRLLRPVVPTQKGKGPRTRVRGPFPAETLIQGWEAGSEGDGVSLAGGFRTISSFTLAASPAIAPI